MSGEGPGQPWTGVARAQVVLAVGAALGFLWLARDLLIPVALGVLLALSVHPLVAWLDRHRWPKPLAAAAGTVVVTLVVVGVGWLLYDRVADFMDDLPSYESRFRQTWAGIRRHALSLQVQSEQLVTPPRQPGQVRVQESVPWGQLLVGTAQGAAMLAGEAAVVVFVIYFALAEGPRYRDKLLALAGSATGRARARAALEDLHRDVELYMLNRVVLNGILGIVIWLVYAIYGLEHASIWGITTALLHFVPYVGPAVGLLLPAGMALLQYGTVRDVAAVTAIYLVLVSVQGNLVDPLFLGKQLRLNALAVFLGSLFWFWLWGPLGLFLAVPLLSTIRIVCNRLPRFRSVAAFLAA